MQTTTLVKAKITDHSMLMFINPSLVSVMPCRPTRFKVPVCGLLRLLLVLSGKSDPIFDLGGGPQILWPESLTAGEFGITGLLWALILGETARRLKRLGSKSSSRPRFRLNSCIMGVGCVILRAELCELGRSKGLANSLVEPTVVDGVMSIAESSSETDGGPVARVDGGGVR